MQKQYILTEKEAQEFAKSADAIKELFLDLAHLRIGLLEKELATAKAETDKVRESAKKQTENYTNHVYELRTKNAYLRNDCAKKESHIKFLLGNIASKDAEIASLSSMLKEAKRDLEGSIIGYQDKIKNLETTIKTLTGLVHELSNPE